MATEAQAFAALARLTPAEAVAYLRQRGQLTRTFAWQDLWQDEHAQQFTVSRLARLDLLQDVRDLITQSVEGELSRRDFMRDARQLLQRAGWWGEKKVLDPATGREVTTTFDPARLKLIFDTNTRMAYAAGQWERFERTRRSHPYLRYITMRDEKVRATHRIWDNVTLPVDHAFWQTHLPPNGWRCRCRVVAVSRREYERGLTPSGTAMVKEAPPIVMRDWVDQRTGEVKRIPVGIDPGFGYNVGVAGGRAAALRETTTAKLEASSADLSRAAITSLALGPAFEAWLRQPAGEWPLARIPDDDAASIGAKQHVARLSAETVQKQQRAHGELSAAEYALAQRVVDEATGKAQDSPTSMIYVLDNQSEDSGGYVLVVKATRTGEGLFVTSFRRLSRRAAQRDAEIARLLGKGRNR